MTTKKIKALEMTRRIRERHAEQLAGYSTAERIAFYRAKAQAMRAQATAKLQAQAADRQT